MQTKKNDVAARVGHDRAAYVGGGALRLVLLQCDATCHNKVESEEEERETGEGERERQKERYDRCKVPPRLEF